MKLAIKSYLLKNTKGFAKTLFSFFIPGGLPFLITIIVLNLKFTDRVLSDSARIYPLIVIGAGLLVGLFLKRVWLMLALLVLALVDRTLLFFVASTGVEMEGGSIIFHALSFLIPFNLCVFAFMKRRGEMTWQSIWFLGGILIQGGAVAFLYQFRGLGFGSFLEYSSTGLSLLEGVRLSQLSLFAFALAFGYYLFLYMRTRRVIDRAFCWALISIFYALGLSKIGPASSIYFSTAGLIFVISVIENVYLEGFQDEVTDLPSGKSMIASLSQLDRGYTVALIEVDNFERLRDNHGRRISKEVLRQVGLKLRIAAAGGKPFRYTGEQFVVVFPGMFLSDTLPHVEELRQTIRKPGLIQTDQKSSRKKPKRVEIQASNVQVKVSIGVAERKDLDMSPRQAIADAEKALMTAKSEGKDRMHPSYMKVEFEEL